MPLVMDFFAMLVLAFLVVFLFHRLLGSRMEGWKYRAYYGGGVALLAAVFITALQAGSLQAVRFFIPAAFLFLYACLGLKGETDVKLFLSLFTISIIVISTSLGALLISFVSRASYEIILMAFSPEHYALLLLIILIFFYAVRLLLQLNSQRLKLGTRDFTFLLIIPVLSVISIFGVLNLAPDSMTDQGTLGTVLVVLTGITVINLLSCYFYVEMGKEHEMELKYLALQKEYDFLQDSSGEIRRYYEEANKVYHDFKRYLTVVLAYLEEESTQEAKEYLQQMIDMKSTFTHHRVICDNNAVNYVLNYILSRCMDRQIDCACTVTASLTQVEDMDFCVLLNNLLDNAIEASEKEEQPGIRLFIHPRGEGLEIRVMNRISHSVLNENPRLHTTKKDDGRHGFGIQNARELVERYGGSMEFYEEDGFFCCLVTGNFTSRKADGKQKEKGGRKR